MPAGSVLLFWSIIIYLDRHVSFSFPYGKSRESEHDLYPVRVNTSQWNEIWLCELLKFCLFLYPARVNTSQRFRIRRFKIMFTLSGFTFTCDWTSKKFPIKIKHSEITHMITQCDWRKKLEKFAKYRQSLWNLGFLLTKQLSQIK